MSKADHERAWEHVLLFVEGLPPHLRVQALQKYIQEGGPIPDALSGRARAILAGGA
jgi:hypothetical protein